MWGECEARGEDEVRTSAAACPCAAPAAPGSTQRRARCAWPGSQARETACSKQVRRAGWLAGGLPAAQRLSPVTRLARPHARSSDTQAWHGQAIAGPAEPSLQRSPSCREPWCPASANLVAWSVWAAMQSALVCVQAAGRAFVRKFAPRPAGQLAWGPGERSGGAAGIAATTLCVSIAKDVLREVLAAASTRSSSRGPVAAFWEL